MLVHGNCKSGPGGAQQTKHRGMTIGEKMLLQKDSRLTPRERVGLDTKPFVVEVKKDQSHLERQRLQKRDDTTLAEKSLGRKPGDYKPPVGTDSQSIRDSLYAQYCKKA